jgi:hypothetical protein
VLSDSYDRDDAEREGVAPRSEAEAAALAAALPAADGRDWSQLARRRLLNYGGAPRP